MKLQNLVLAVMATLVGAGNAMADGRDPFPGEDGRHDYQLQYAAEAVEYEADVLVQILSRERADARVTYNARLVLDYSLYLLDALNDPWGRGDYYYDVQEVLAAHRNLHREWNYARVRPSYYAAQQLRQLDFAVQDLRRAVDGGITFRP